MQHESKNIWKPSAFASTLKIPPTKRGQSCAFPLGNDDEQAGTYGDSLTMCLRAQARPFDVIRSYLSSRKSVKPVA
jgi:hypothetical protein